MLLPASAIRCLPVVFGIAVGKVWHEVEGSLSTLTGEINGQAVGGENNDELSLRRKLKGA